MELADEDCWEAEEFYDAEEWEETQGFWSLKGHAYIYGNSTSGPFVGLVSRRWLGVSVVYFGFCFLSGICISLGMFVVIARTNLPFNRASLPGRRGCIFDNFFVYLLTPTYGACVLMFDNNVH